MLRLNVAFVVVLTSTLACSRSPHVATDAAPDSAVSDAPERFPAILPPAPVLGSSGGPVLANPVVINVSFSDDPLTGSLDAFGAWLATPQFAGHFGSVMHEYGVGTLADVRSIHVPTSAPANLDTTVRDWIRSNLSGTTPAWGSPVHDGIYVIYYSPTVAADCSQNGGYHSDVMLTDGTPVSYAVVRRCSSTTGTQMDAVTATATHEIFEAATDPYVNAHPAYNRPDPLAWGEEIADMCELEPPMNIGSVVVARSWSNTSAAAGHDPCGMRGSDDPYFNSAFAAPDVITAGIDARQTHGLTIPVGTSRAVELELFSDRPTSGPWKVAAFEVPLVPSDPPSLELSLDRPTGKNGDTLHLTLRATRRASSYGTRFLVVSTLGAVNHYWWGIVTN
jgi:hypothetical protein